MKRKYEAIVLGIILMGLLIFVGYQFMGGKKTSPAQTSYSTNLQKLKADFNADKGKVRLVVLLSPT